jgi:xylulokinase
MDVYVSTTKEAAAMGGALLAKYAWWKSKLPEGQLEDQFEDMTGGELAGETCVATTHPDVAKIYDDLVPVYTKCEEQVVKALGN